MDMADCESGLTELEKEEDLIAAAKQIARALGSRKSLTDEARKILADLGAQLSSISMSMEREGEEEESGCEIERLLDSVQEKVASWDETDQSMIWESGFEEWSEFLAVVDEATSLAERLESLCSIDRDGLDLDVDYDRSCELQGRAQDVLQTAMDRLEEEFRYVLVHHRQRCDHPEAVSFRSSEEDNGSVISSGGDDNNSFEEHGGRDSLSEDSPIEPVSPGVVPELRAAANSMFRAKYDKECVEAFTGLRKDALEECLAVLDVERLGIEDVIRTEWGVLNSKIKRWIRAVRAFVRVHLAGERWLCDRVFCDLGAVGPACFVESSKASVLQLLNFGEAMSVGTRQPEKLLRVIDMYEALAGLAPDIEALYSGCEAGAFVSSEFHEVLGRLGYCVRATFLEFRSAVASNPSSSPIAGGGIHPLTRYVMNYMRTLTDNSETLDRLFHDHDHGPSPGSSPGPGGEGKEEEGGAGASPVARHFLSLATVLERNLEAKSSLYRDVSLQHLFLMNNTHYMAQKVKGPELRPIFGDKWIRRCNGRFQQHAIDYQRASWGSILSLLREEGIQNPGSNSNSNSNSVSKSVLKERFRSFYAAFEEVYRAQTGWTIPDAELREDVRISTSLNVIQAYRIFEGRHFNHISERHIKYSADDLERYLLDLFEGSGKTLQSHSRR